MVVSYFVRSALGSFRATKYSPITSTLDTDTCSRQHLLIHQSADGTGTVQASPRPDPSCPLFFFHLSPFYPMVHTLRCARHPANGPLPLVCRPSGNSLLPGEMRLVEGRRAHAFMIQRKPETNRSILGSDQGARAADSGRGTSPPAARGDPVENGTRRGFSSAAAPCGSAGYTSRSRRAQRLCQRWGRIRARIAGSRYCYVPVVSGSLAKKGRPDWGGGLGSSKQHSFVRCLTSSRGCL